MNSNAEVKRKRKQEKRKRDAFSCAYHYHPILAACKSSAYQYLRKRYPNGIDFECKS